MVPAPTIRLDLLKKVLQIPTYTFQEHFLVAFLCDYAASRGWYVWEDEFRNVYVRKGEAAVYPCVSAHIDSVHDLEDYRVVEKDDRLIAIGRGDRQTGLGGDDKAGVFICLELLERFDAIKAVFFSGEERFCFGSARAEPQFFKDVGYCIEFDSPENDLMSFSSNGEQLFESLGDFIRIAMPHLENWGVTKWQKHPYTDVYMLRKRFDFSCLNLPAGYYRMHSKQEYVKPADVANAVGLGRDLIDVLGQRYFPVVVQGGTAPRPVTHLILTD